MNETLTDALVSIERWTGLTPAAQTRLIETLVVILVLVVIRGTSMRIVAGTVDDPRTRYQWRKAITYLLAIVGVFAVARIWLSWFGNLSTFLGLASAGLAIALRDPISNIFGWVFLMWRRPFSVGDRIQIGEYAGDVVDQRLFQFTLLEIGNWVDADQSTGRIVHVPNAQVFTEPQASYTRGFSYIWNELYVTVTFESDWRKAKRILQEIVERDTETITEEARRGIKHASREFMIVYSNLTPIVYTDYRENGVRLTMRYLCDPRRRRGSAAAIWEDVLDAFGREHDIAFAYPTTRFFDNAVEGKAGGEGRDVHGERHGHRQV